jgi:cytochrome b
MPSMEQNTKTVLVYDWPTRIFHAFFILFFTSSFFIAKTSNDESPLFAYHMLGGIMLLFVAALRLFWSVVGSPSASPGSFTLNPKALVEYLQSFWTTKKDYGFSKNPATSWVAVVMLISILGLGFSGYRLSTLGEDHFVKEMHELFAHLLFASVLVHVAGVIVHSIKHKDPIGLAMLTGKKQIANNISGIKSSHSFLGLIFIGIILFFAQFVSSRFDSNTKQLVLFGQVLTLGETENEDHEKENLESTEHED